MAKLYIPSLLEKRSQQELAVTASPGFIKFIQPAGNENGVYDFPKLGKRPQLLITVGDIFDLGWMETLMKVQEIPKGVSLYY